MRVAPIGRWFLPWACVLVVSATIAHAAGDALELNLHETPAPVESVTLPPCTQACPHWVEISSIDKEDNAVNVNCLVTNGSLSADVLKVHFDDFITIVTDVCSERGAPREP
jgi:hypothetical protein